MTILIKQNADGAYVTDVSSGIDLFKCVPNRGGYTDPQSFCTFFDDFLGDAITTPWSAAVGTDAQVVIATPSTSTNYRPYGWASLTSGDTTVIAESLSSLTHALNWRPSNGEIYMKTRIALASVNNIGINVGFSDVLATTTLEEPFSISGTTITSNASDAACFVFDTAQTNDNFHIQGVKADTDTAINNTGVAPVINTPYDLEMIITPAGHVTFFINGTNYGTVANAVTPTVSLTPIFTTMARTTTSKLLLVDYVFIAQARATTIS